MKDVFPLTILSNILCPKQNYLSRRKVRGDKALFLEICRSGKGLEYQQNNGRH